MTKKKIKKEIKKITIKEKVKKLIKIIGNSVGLAMGVAVIVLTCLKKIETNQAVNMVAIGLFCVSLPAIMKRN